MRIIFLFMLFSSVISSITDCGSTNGLFQITKLGLTPDPPIIGKDVDLTLFFENPESDISEGIVETHVSINGIPYPPSTEDLCKSTTCPIIKGENNRSTKSVWPDISGKIISTLTWKKLSGELLLCLQTSVKVSTIENLRGSNSSFI